MPLNKPPNTALTTQLPRKLLKLWSRGRGAGGTVQQTFLRDGDDDGCGEILFLSQWPQPFPPTGRLADEERTYLENTEDVSMSLEEKQPSFSKE